MTDTLWHVADQAYPTDPALMPADVRVVLGYVGGAADTPHVWTVDEVARVQAHGKLWAPIHTVPRHWVGSDLGRLAATSMIVELRRYPYPSHGPVFLDVEHATYAEAPAQVLAQVADWQRDMHAAGHGVALAYLPWSAGRQWAANWTGVRPTVLPDNLQGWQYQQAVNGRGYDLSVFRAGVFATLADTKGSTMAGLTQADKDWMVAQLTKVRDQLLTTLGAEHSDSDKLHPHPAANVHLLALLRKIDAQTSDSSGAGVNVDQLAQAVAAHLGPVMGGQLVQALSRQLGKP